MKIFHKVFVLFLFSFSLSCNSDDCSDIACNSGPAAFQLELVDSVSGENLFTNGTFEKSELSLRQISGENVGDWSFISENEVNILQIGTSGNITYSVKISGEELFQVSIEAKPVTENCCSYTQVNDFQITGAEFDLDEDTGIYKILIDTSAE